jgi:hypothetical protein
VIKEVFPGMTDDILDEYINSIKSPETPQKGRNVENLLQCISFETPERSRQLMYNSDLAQPPIDLVFQGASFKSVHFMSKALSTQRDRQYLSTTSDSGTSTIDSTQRMASYTYDVLDGCDFSDREVVEDALIALLNFVSLREPGLLEANDFASQFSRSVNLISKILAHPSLISAPSGFYSITRKREISLENLRNFISVVRG